MELLSILARFECVSDVLHALGYGSDCDGWGLHTGRRLWIGEQNGKSSIRKASSGVMRPCWDRLGIRQVSECRGFRQGTLLLAGWLRLDGPTGVQISVLASAE